MRGLYKMQKMAWNWLKMVWNFFYWELFNGKPMQFIYIYSCSTQLGGLYGKNEKLTRCEKGVIDIVYIYSVKLILLWTPNQFMAG